MAIVSFSLRSRRHGENICGKNTKSFRNRNRDQEEAGGGAVKGVLIVLVLDTAGTMTVTYIREFIYLVRLY